MKVNYIVSSGVGGEEKAAATGSKDE